MIDVGAEFSYDYVWTPREVALHALSVGARADTDLAWVWEDAPLRVPGVFALAPFAGLVMRMIGAFGLDVKDLLHVGQEVEVRGALPASGTARVTRRVVEVMDKGRAALVVCEDAFGELAVGRSTWWIARAAPAAEPRGGAAAAPAPLDGPPAEWRAEWVTTREQAALHRLVGDTNPVHISPAAARAAGQERAFLHGLCTFGALGLALEREAGRPLVALRGRFTKPVLPGDALTFEAWDGYTRARVSVGGDLVLGPVAAGFAAG